MHLTVKGKQLDVGDALRSHVAETLKGAVGKYFGNPIDATVVFSRDAHLFRADISVHVGRNVLVQSNGASEDAYLAFDDASDKIAERLRRYKGRLKKHHATTALESQPASQYILEREPEGGDGEDEARLRSLAAGMPNVHFAGRVANEHLSRYYEHALAVVCPSVGYETFGIVLIEAMRARVCASRSEMAPSPSRSVRAKARESPAKLRPLWAEVSRYLPAAGWKKTLGSWPFQE